MERQDILEAMSELKLYGMRASFDEIAGKGLVRRDEIYPLLASLIRAERVHRQAKSISYRMRCAKFPVLKDLDSFVFADTPVDQGLVRELATGAFLDAKRNAIFIGGTGTGKSHLCIARRILKEEIPKMIKEIKKQNKVEIEALFFESNNPSLEKTVKMTTYFQSKLTTHCRSKLTTCCQFKMTSGCRSKVTT